MVEKNLIINNRIITYKGVFLVREFFNVINDALKKTNYQKQEKKTEEVVTAGGRKTHIELRPFKVKSNYMTLMLKIKINLANITEVTKIVDHVPKVFQQGEVEVAFDAWSITDHGARWGMKPWFYFMKGIINKYFYRYQTDEEHMAEMIGDVDYMGRQIKSLLGLYKYQVSGDYSPPKEDIPEKVVKEELPEKDLVENQE
ncbi:MAG: hypothetical protein CMI53_02830 [Parcubacteria group bacterium]|nr:hypothetical protein [Parcubacteria group bacterium]|tara:strand:- start:964 stop:1563 length:600 start_codon:yes stop_codon:yes gene_type:complete